MNQTQLDQITTETDVLPLTLVHTEWLDRVTVDNPPHPYILIDEWMTAEFPEASNEELSLAFRGWAETVEIRAAVWLYEFVQGLTE